MEELIQTVADKTGLTPDQAKSAIEAVVGVIKDKLPMGLGDKIESMLQGGSDTSSESSSLGGELLGGLKNLF